MFSSSVNPTTGKLEWIAQERDVTSEEADISHELARSQYGDMLLDKSRVSGFNFLGDSFGSSAYDIN